MEFVHGKTFIHTRAGKMGSISFSAAHCSQSTESEKSSREFKPYFFQCQYAIFGCLDPQWGRVAPAKEVVQHQGDAREF